LYKKKNHDTFQLLSHKMASILGYIPGKLPTASKLNAKESMSI